MISIKHENNIFLKICLQSPEEGAQTTIYLAVSDEVTNVSGKYFVDCQVDIFYNFCNFFL